MLTSILSPFSLSLLALESKIVDFCAFGLLAFHGVVGYKIRKEPLFSLSSGAYYTHCLWQFSVFLPFLMCTSL